jgi:N,N'-diacetyllegionaminate synthase
MKIGKRDTSDRIFIIAEIGNNHEGDFGLAIEMVQMAVEAGADAVKFQTIVPTRLVSEADEKRVRQLTRFQFDANQFEELSRQAEASGLSFISTPFDLEVVTFLNPLVCAFKIASGDNDFWPLIDRVTQTGKPLIVSMGLGQVGNAQAMIDFVEKSAKKHDRQVPEIALLHCVVSYPTPPEQAGIVGVTRLAQSGVTVGYSDHTMGTRAAELAVAAGARIIEKHFTIDKNYSDFRDHQLSADPSELSLMVKAIREVEKMLGKKETIAPACEVTNETVMRRSIAANRNINVGETVRWEDLCWLRPRVALKPGEEDMICGRKLIKSIRLGEAFTLDHIQ